MLKMIYEREFPKIVTQVEKSHYTMQPAILLEHAGQNLGFIAFWNDT